MKRRTLPFEDELAHARRHGAGSDE
jgi:hypothetical protein